MDIHKGEKYRHFKGNIYEIVDVAINTETLEEMIVYKDSEHTWVRPKDMFTSEVDRNKYPEAKQKYRFELIQND